MNVKDNREIIQKVNYDVIVVGGGIAGVSAAVSAARQGVSVLLTEKSVNLGGLATSGLISWYEPLCDGCGNQMIGGIAEELIKLAAKYSFDNLPSRWGGEEKNKKKNDRYSTYFSPTVFALALDEFVLESGANIRFDTYAVYPVMEDKLCRGIITESAGGKEFFGAKVVIDATGDATVMERAGVPTVIGENYMTYIAHCFDTEAIERFNQSKDICKLRMWKNAGADMFGNGHPDGMRKLKGTTAEDITEYVIAGKRSLLGKLKEKDKNSYDIMTLPFMPQFRTIRHIVGKTDFTAEDGLAYSDAIGSCGDFRPNGAGKHYQIPFGALYNENFDNLLAVGRIISAPQGDGWEVSRVIPVCALTGEAAGKAAAFCVKNNCGIQTTAQRYIGDIFVV